MSNMGADKPLASIRVPKTLTDAMFDFAKAFEEKIKRTTVHLAIRMLISKEVKSKPFKEMSQCMQQELLVNMVGEIEELESAGKLDAITDTLKRSSKQKEQQTPEHSRPLEDQASETAPNPGQESAGDKTDKAPDLVQEVTTKKPPVPATEVAPRPTALQAAEAPKEPWPLFRGEPVEASGSTPSRAARANRKHLPDSAKLASVSIGRLKASAPAKRMAAKASASISGAKASASVESDGSDTPRVTSREANRWRRQLQIPASWNFEDSPETKRARTSAVAVQSLRNANPLEAACKRLCETATSQAPAAEKSSQVTAKPVEVAEAPRPVPTSLPNGLQHCLEEVIDASPSVLSHDFACETALMDTMPSQASTDYEDQVLSQNSNVSRGSLGSRTQISPETTLSNGLLIRERPPSAELPDSSKQTRVDSLIDELLGGISGVGALLQGLTATKGAEASDEEGV